MNEWTNDVVYNARKTTSTQECACSQHSGWGERRVHFFSRHMPTIRSTIIWAAMRSHTYMHVRKRTHTHTHAHSHMHIHMHTHSEYWMRVKSIWHLYALGIRWGGIPRWLKTKRKTPFLSQIKHCVHLPTKHSLHTSEKFLSLLVLIVVDMSYVGRFITASSQTEHCVPTWYSLHTSEEFPSLLAWIIDDVYVDRFITGSSQTEPYVYTEHSLHTIEKFVTFSVDHCGCVYFDRFTTEWLQTEQQVLSGSWRVSCWATHPPLAGSSHNPSPRPLKL